MAQIQKGDTFTNGQQVDATRLNQLLDSSVLLVGAISEQATMTPNTVESSDQTIINDGGIIKKTTIGSLLNSNLPVTTSSITGGAGVDITVTPAAGQKMDVGGEFEASSINSVGNTTIGGTLTVTGGIIGANTNIAGTLTASTAPTASGHLTNKTYVDGTFSKTANGYCVLPNGIILQWATGLGGTAEASQTITFPIPFPTACLNTIVSTVSLTADVGANNWFQEISSSRTEVVVYRQVQSGSALFWSTPKVFAIGY